MTNLIIALTAVIIIAGLYKTIRNKIKKEHPIVNIDNHNVTINWKGHSIIFNFKIKDGVLHYTGATCNEKYSCSVATTNDLDYPYALYAKCENDTIAIRTNLKNKYEVI